MLASAEREILAVAEPLAGSIEQVLPGLRERRFEFRDEVFRLWCQLVPQGAIPNVHALREMYASEGPWVINPVLAAMPRFLDSLTPQFIRMALGDDVPRCDLTRLITVAGQFLERYPEHHEFQQRREGHKRKAGRDLSERLHQVAETFATLELYLFTAVVGLH
jgi:hypothetical protein